jgi:acyl-CoA synthetase (AMP-forming)/AMP-acid ligase II
MQALFEGARRAAAMPTLAELVDAQVRRRRDDVALQSPQGSLTYGALAARVGALAAHLHRSGLRRGDRMAILSENRFEFVEVLLAAARLGATCACLNWRLAGPELRDCIALVTPAVAFVSPKFEEHAALFEGMPLHRFGAAYERLATAESLEIPPVAAEPEDGLHILFTSGTTGRPKGALISQRAVVARGTVAVLDGAFRTARTHITWAPMFHQMGTDNTLTTLAFGGKVIVLDGPRLDAMCDALEHETNLGWLGLTPGMADEMLERLRERGITPQPLDSVGSMADLLPRQRIAEITRLFNAPFRNSFGATEAGSAPASGHLIPVGVAPEDLDKIESTFARVRLVDEQGRDVADGEPGELLLRSPTLFSGYWGMPEATAEAFRDGWYCTGDVFVRQPTGRLAYVDRRKYLIKTGGENVYPAEIEQVLRTHPALGEVVVVRRRDERWGEVPVAFVELRGEPVTEAELIEYCRGKIAKYKLPKGVRFLPAADFPRNVTGKVMRQPLEQLLERE